MARKERQGQKGSLVPPAAGLQVSGWCRTVILGGIVAELVCVRCQVSFSFGLSVFRKQNSFCLLLVT